MRLTGLTATQPGGKPCVQVGTWLSPLAFRGLRGSLGWRPALLPPPRPVSASLPSSVLPTLFPSLLYLYFSVIVLSPLRRKSLLPSASFCVSVSLSLPLSLYPLLSLLPLLTPSLGFSTLRVPPLSSSLGSAASDPGAPRGRRRLLPREGTGDRPGPGAQHSCPMEHQTPVLSSILEGSFSQPSGPPGHLLPMGHLFPSCPFSSPDSDLLPVSLFLLWVSPPPPPVLWPMARLPTCWGWGCLLFTSHGLLDAD